MTSSLLLVAAFMVGLACLPYLIKRVQQKWGLQAGVPGAEAKLLSALAVGPHERVVTVEAGPPQARVYLVLGVSSQGVTCLYTCPLAQAAQAPVVGALGSAASAKETGV